MTALETRLDQMPPRVGQILIITICLLLNIADGFDVLAMAYAAPGLSEEWSVSPEELGVVFSAALLGMALGSMFLAPLADTFGRRKMVLIAAVLVTASMFITIVSTTLWQLIILRLLAGLGIGIIVPISATLATEYSPKAIRASAVLIVAAGFSIGLMIAGLVAEEVISAFGWRGMFVAGGAVTGICFLLALPFLKESVFYLASSRLPEETKLTRINKILASIRHTPVESLGEAQGKKAEKSSHVKELFTPELRVVTIQVWLLWFTYYWAVYIITNWMPTLFVYNGYTEVQGIDALTNLTVGVLVGAIVLGFLSIRAKLAPMAAGMLYLSAALTAVWVLSDFDFSTQTLILGGVGFMLSANYGLYSIVAGLYPAHIRATGMGSSSGFGRIGGILSPLVTGFVVAAGWNLEQMMLVLVVPPLMISATLVVLIAKRANT